jgi:hypothetical protein
MPRLKRSPVPFPSNFSLAPSPPSENSCATVTLPSRLLSERDHREAAAFGESCLRAIFHRFHVPHLFPYRTAGPLGLIDDRRRSPPMNETPLLIAVSAPSPSPHRTVSRRPSHLARCHPATSLELILKIERHRQRAAARGVAAVTTHGACTPRRLAWVTGPAGRGLGPKVSPSTISVFVFIFLV